MRLMILAGAALALSACGGGESNEQANAANTMAADNMMLDQNLMMDQNMSMDSGTGIGTNGAADAESQNLMQQDATTNDPDTNLANGL